MPKQPILNRECFYDTLNDGTLRHLDWNLVNTSLGACIEPRQVCSVHINSGTVQIDVVDASFNRITPMDEDAFYRLMGTGGRLIPINFS